MAERMRRVAALLLTCVLMLSAASAELVWPESLTPAQAALQTYIEQVNENLELGGQTPINTIFELYPTYAALGATADPSLLMPEGVEMYFSMYDTSLNTLELMVSDVSLFGNLAAGCLQAAAGDSMTLEAAQQYVQPYVQRVMAALQNSFEETVVEMNGTAPRAYFAYYPNLFQDGVNWLQMTLIFPLAGANDEFAAATPAPDGEATYEGYIDYHPEDDYTHLEVFATATPEPDSPAAEEYD